MAHRIFDKFQIGQALGIGAGRIAVRDLGDRTDCSVEKKAVEWGVSSSTDCALIVEIASWHRHLRVSDQEAADLPLSGQDARNKRLCLVHDALISA